MEIKINYIYFPFPCPHHHAVKIVVSYNVDSWIYFLHPCLPALSVPCLMSLMSCLQIFCLSCNLSPVSFCLSAMLSLVTGLVLLTFFLSFSVSLPPIIFIFFYLSSPSFYQLSRTGQIKDDSRTGRLLSLFYLPVAYTLHVSIFGKWL